MIREQPPVGVVSRRIVIVLSENVGSVVLLNEIELNLCPSYVFMCDGHSNEYRIGKENHEKLNKKNSTPFYLIWSHWSEVFLCVKQFEQKKVSTPKENTSCQFYVEPIWSEKLVVAPWTAIDWVSYSR